MTITQIAQTIGCNLWTTFLRILHHAIGFNSQRFALLFEKHFKWSLSLTLPVCQSTLDNGVWLEVFLPATFTVSSFSEIHMILVSVP